MTKSEMLLGRLIEERLTPNADTADIDRRIRTLFEEEWCVVCISMAGFSRHSAEAGIIPLLTLIHEFKRIARPIIEASDGLVVKVIASTLLILFRRAPDGLACSQAVHRALAAYNQTRDPEGHIEVSAGIGFGRMLKIGDEDVFGVEVNYAAKLGDDLAAPNETVVTDAARAALMHTPGVEFEPFTKGQKYQAFRVRSTT